MEYSLSSPTPHRHRSRTENYTPKRSKLDLSKNAILDILTVAQTQFPNCKFSVISWNSSTKILNGNFIEMQKHVSELYADGGTEFENMFKCIKTFTKGPLDKFILLTDGHDSNGVEKIEELKKDITLTQLFDGIIGVGNETDVDHVFLNHLSLNNPSVYTLTSDEKEISELVHSLCFSALNTIFAENITLRILCKKTDLYIPNGENMSITYKNTYDLVEDLPQSSLFTFQTSHNGVVLISPTEQKKSSDHHQHIVFALDTSGSMADETQKNSTKQNAKEEAESTDCKFVEFVIQLKMMSPEYKMLFYANAIDVTVEYTYKGVLYHERIKKEVASVSDEKIFDLGHRMLYISKQLSKKHTKEELKTLYMDHLNIVNEMENEMGNEMENIPEWLVHQVKKVAESLRNRYMYTLTKGERFFEDSASSPSLLALCRSASAGASQTREYESSYYVDKTKCKICFVNEANIVMLPCKHIGTCKECIKTCATISTCTCPFCRQEITDYISLKSVMLCSCKNVATHIGTCGHALFCKQKKCRDDFSSNFSTCIRCQKKVDTIKVYMC